MTRSSQNISLAAWNLLLSQRQDFSSNHLARVPVTPNQQGRNEMKDKVLSSVGVQDMDTSAYQLSDLDDVEFCWEDDQLDVDVFLDRALITPFQQQRLTTWRLEVEQKTSFCLMTKRTRELSSNITSPWETKTTPCNSEKSSVWNNNRI